MTELKTTNLPAGSVSAGVVRDAEALKSVVEPACKANENRQMIRTAAVAIHCPKTMIRFTDLPLMKDKLLDKAVSYAYENAFPTVQESRVYGWKKCGLKNGRQMVAMAALPLEVSESWVSLFQSLRMELICLDVAESAAADGFVRCSTQSDLLHRPSVLLLYEKDGLIVTTHMLQGQMVSLWKSSLDEKPGLMEMKRGLCHHMRHEELSERNCVYCVLTPLPVWVEGFMKDAGISHMVAQQSFSELVLTGMREKLYPKRKGKKV